MPGLFLGIDSLAVNENVEGTRPTHPNASGNLQLVKGLFQAHGPRLDLTSKETSLDIYCHLRCADIITLTHRYGALTLRLMLNSSVVWGAGISTALVVAPLRQVFEANG